VLDTPRDCARDSGEITALGDLITNFVSSRHPLSIATLDLYSNDNLQGCSLLHALRAWTTLHKAEHERLNTRTGRMHTDPVSDRMRAAVQLIAVLI